MYKNKKNLPESIGECGKITAPRMIPDPNPWDCQHDEILYL